MRIKLHESDGKVVGYALWLSANDTYAWAHKPGARWPCSEASGHRLVVCVDSNGLYDCALNGKDCKNLSGDEVCAIVGDHIPETCRHLWPN